MGILHDVRKALGVPDTSFDHEILIHLNSVVLGLLQIGIAAFAETGVIDELTDWPEDDSPTPIITAYKSLIVLRMKLLFDPPANVSIRESILQHISEIESRLGLEIRDIQQFFESLKHNYIRLLVDSILQEYSDTLLYRHNIQPTHILADETVIIPQGYQLVVWNKFTIDGKLVNNGELIITGV
jgi:hypothetical protein